MFISIKRLTKLLTLILIFSFTTIYADTELNLPAFSQLGKEIANGRAVYSDNFYWINADGTIGSTNRGWSRVPKESRNLVYLSMQDAQSSLDEYSITDEERAEQARKEAEEKAEQARKEAQAREATKKRKEQEETAAKNQAAYFLWRHRIVFQRVARRIGRSSASERNTARRVGKTGFGNSSCRIAQARPRHPRNHRSQKPTTSGARR